MFPSHVWVHKCATDNFFTSKAAVPIRTGNTIGRGQFFPMSFFYVLKKKKCPRGRDRGLNEVAWSRIGTYIVIINTRVVAPYALANQQYTAPWERP